MSATSPRFVIDDLNELLNEKSSWLFNLESNKPIDKYLKYNECKTVDEVKAINPNYLDDIEDGAWNYRLDALEDGSNLLEGCDELTSFNVELPNLYYGSNMFDGCANLTSFNSDLSKLDGGNGMFRFCPLDGASIRRILTGKDENGNDIIGKISGKLVCIPGSNQARAIIPPGVSPLLTFYINSQDAYDTFVEITGYTLTQRSELRVV